MTQESPQVGQSLTIVRELANPNLHTLHIKEDDS